MARQIDLSQTHLRVARPSDNLEAVVTFYRDGLASTCLRVQGPRWL